MMLKKPGFGFGDSQPEKRDYAIADGILETGAPCSQPIARMFMSIFEGKLRDS